MIKNYSFEYVQDIPIKLIDDLVEALPDPDTWKITKRESINRALAESRSIPFRLIPNPTNAQRLNGTNGFQDTDNMDKYPQIKPILNIITEMTGMELGRVTLAYLAPHTHVHPHADRGEYLEAVTRYVIALTTNEDCAFWCNNKKYHQEVGTMYLFNNQHLHSASNGGNTGRIHLIVDLLPKN